MHDYDVIIIGAGIGGLTCGALLAKHGMSVLICEQHDKPGGYCTSYKRGGAVFDIPHVMGGLRPGTPVERILHILGISRSVQFVEMDRVARFAYPDVVVNWFSDIAEYEAELTKRFPGSRRAIAECLRSQQAVWDGIAGLSSLFGRQEQVTLARAEELLRVRGATYDEYLAGFFRDYRLPEVLGSGWPLLGADCADGSALSMLAMVMSYHATGAWRPKGGFQKLADALSMAFKHNSGTLQLSSRVEHVLAETDGVRGVVLEDGRQMSARLVVSNADTRLTMLSLLPELAVSSDLVAEVRTVVPSAAALSVHLVVKMELPSHIDCCLNIYYPTYEAADEQWRLSRRGLFVTEPGRLCFALVIPTLVDPSLAPTGHHVVEVVTMPVPRTLFDVPPGGDRSFYEKKKAAAAEGLLEAAERVLPGLGASAKTCDISTPITYERYTGAVGGCSNDMVRLPAQAALRRKLAYEPVRGFYLTGTKNVFGSGIYGAILGGFDTADAILGRKLSREGVLWK